MSTIPKEEQRVTGDAVLSRMTPVHRTISTLDPKKLKSSDFIDFSGRRAPCVILDTLDSCELRYGWSKRHEPFPANTFGFLYYHLPPNLPPTCGQVRFRVTTSNDPKQFEQGTDLIGLDATPWSISTFSIMCPAYETLRKQLLRDQLITDAFVDTMIDLQKKYAVSKTSPRELYYLEQPFMFDMQMQLVSFRLVTPSEVRTMKLANLLVDYRANPRLLPYQGQLLLRFERCTLPENYGTDTVVLRVLKVLTPIKLTNSAYDAHVPMPKAGTLLLRRYRCFEVFVRSWDLDDQYDDVSSALKILPRSR